MTNAKKSVIITRSSFETAIQQIEQLYGPDATFYAQQMAERYNITIVEDGEAEAADFCVCRPREPGIWDEGIPFVDNMLSTCCDCGEAVVFNGRTAPLAPPKICTHCAAKRRAEGA